MEGTPPGDASPPPPQRATLARKGARCGASAGSPRPHRPHPEHTGRGTPAARPRGRAVGGGTAPDTRRPSQRWQATPPGDGPPPPPRHAAPTGRAGQGDRVGPAHPHARAHSTWVADPNSPPSRRAVGGEGAPDLRHPSQRWKACPPGTPFRHPQSEQRRPGKAHAVEPVLGPHACTDRARDTRGAGPRPPAPEDRRQGGGQRLTPDAPRNGGRPPPRDRGRTRGGARTTWNGPTSAQCRDRARCARHTTKEGGGGRRGRASSHTRKGHAGTTRRATGPSSRNPQTAWNGVPANKGKGHPDGTPRHTQPGTRGAGRGKREGHNTRYRPKPLEPAASAAHTRTGQCTCQGSSGALRHAPTPRQGTLRASPRGSHWRQASSPGDHALGGRSCG